MIEDLWNDDKERVEAITFRRPNGLLIGTTTNKYGEITVDQNVLFYVKRM